MTKQQIYTAANGAVPDFIDTQHLACVLLLDTSASMQNGNAIGALNKAICTFKEKCMSNQILCKGLDVALVNFSTNVTILQEFTPVAQMSLPTLTADGQTSMGAALGAAIDLLDSRKALYRELGVPYHRPWIFMITDGAPNDDYEWVLNEIRKGQQHRLFELWAVGVPGYDKEVLSAFTSHIIELGAELDFTRVFEWLANSLITKNANRLYDDSEISTNIEDWGCNDEW